MNKGEKLKERRKSLQLTLKEVAAAVGVAEATVQRWESGNIHTIRADRLTKLSLVLGVPVEELTSWFDQSDVRSNSLPSPYSEEHISQYIKEKYGLDSLDLLSQISPLSKTEKIELEKILAEYIKLDDFDRAKVRGNMVGAISILLSDLKYSPDR